MDEKVNELGAQQRNHRMSTFPVVYTTYKWGIRWSNDFHEAFKGRSGGMTYGEFRQKYTMFEEAYSHPWVIGAVTDLVHARKPITLRSQEGQVFIARVPVTAKSTWHFERTVDEDDGYEGMSIVKS